MKIDIDNLRFFERISKAIHITLLIKYGVDCSSPRFGFEDYPTCEIFFDDILIGNSIVRVVLNPEENLIAVAALHNHKLFFSKKIEMRLALYGTETGEVLANGIFIEFKKATGKE